MTLFHHLQQIQLKHTICLIIKDLIKTKKDLKWNHLPKVIMKVL